MDPSPRDLHQDTCVKKIISETIDGRTVDSRGGVNPHRMAVIHRNFGASKGNTWTHLNGRWRSGDGNDSALMIVAHDRGSIVANSPLIDAPQSPLIDVPRSSCDRGHQIHLSTGSNGPNFLGKISFKNRCALLFSLNS